MRATPFSMSATASLAGARRPLTASTTRLSISRRPSMEIARTKNESAAAGRGARGRRPAVSIRAASARSSGSTPRAAASPAAMISSIRSKSSEVTPSSSGVISTSHWERCCSLVSAPMKPMAWPRICMKLFSSSRPARGLPTSTPTTTSAPIRATSWTGKLRPSIPSTSRRSPISTGVKAEGMAMLARSASERSPWSSTTVSPVTMSVATQTKGIGNEEKSLRPCTGRVRRSKRAEIFWPATSPRGRPIPAPTIGSETM